MLSAQDLDSFTSILSGQTYSQGVFNQPWRGTSHYRFPIIPWAPDQMDDIKERWAVMRGKTREQQLLRHITIETNLLESAFSLTSAVSTSISWPLKMLIDL